MIVLKKNGEIDSSSDAAPKWSPPHLLEDTPAGIDEFGGGHERLALALADLISVESGGRAIALTGRYGSGKSTVIRIMETALETSPVAVFTFDAWAHSGDPLRRSFLEELVAFLEKPERRWAEEGKWEDELGKLSRKIEEKDETTGPKLTTAGVLFAMFALLLPLGFALFSRYGLTNRWGWVGFYLVILPFAIVAVPALWGSLRWVVSKISKKPVEKWKQTVEDAFSLLVREKYSRTKSTTIRTPDPTTVEFRAAFRKIVAAALATDDRKLVVVVDNLDRLPADQAVSAWGTMRTFFDSGAGEPEPWENRFWLVAPFDTVALARSWDRAEGGSHEGTDAGNLDDLIEKTFGVVLDVPPPVLSDWKEYFLNRLHQAFPYWHKHREGELHAVYRLFLTERNQGAGPPTPRQIKIFSNKLAALDRQWQGALPLRTLAFYLLASDRIDPAGEIFRSDSLVGPATKSILGDDWRKEVGAVHFNVPPSKVDQVLIGDKVAAALASGDGKEIEVLSGTAGLDEVVLQNVQLIAEDGTLTEAAFASRALASSSIDESPSIREAWQALVSQLDLSRPFELQSTIVAEGIAELAARARLLDKYSRARLIVEAGASALSVKVASDEDEAEAVSTTVERWASTAIPVLRAAREVDSKDDFVQIKVECDGTAFAEIMSRLGTEDDGSALVRRVTCPVNADLVMARFTVLAQEGNLRLSHIRALDLIAFIPDGNDKRLKWSFIDLNNAVQTRLLSGAEFADVEVDALVEYLDRRRRAAETKTLHNTVHGSGVLHNLLSKHYENSALAAKLVSILLVIEPDLPEPTVLGDSHDGQSKLIEIVTRPADHPETVAALVELSRVSSTRSWSMWSTLGRAQQHPNSAALAHEIIRSAASADHLLDTITVEEYRYADTLHEALGDEFHEIVRSHLSDSDFVDTLTAIGPGSSLPVVAYRAIGDVATDDQWADFWKYISGELEAIDEEKWLGYLKKEDRPVLLAGALAEDMHDPELGNELGQALYQFALALLDDAEPHVPLDPSVSSLAVDALSVDAAETLLRNIRDLVMKQGQGSLGVLLPVFGNSLASRGRWEEVAVADAAVRGLFFEIAREGGEEELSWLSSLFSENQTALRNAARESRVTLHDAIGKRAKENEFEVLRRILRKLLSQVRATLKQSKRNPIAEFFFGPDDSLDED